VLNAVLGRLAEADAMVFRFGPAIRRVAHALAKQHPFERKPLHRGVLLEGPFGLFDPSGRAFTSWSEDADVAEWFADPRAHINEYIAMCHPRATGHLLTSTDELAVLWHHSWSKLENWPRFAKMHPEMGPEGARQLEWAMHTQVEVVTEPPTTWPALRLFVPTRPPLDDRYAPPWIPKLEEESP
jgi:hypothetical protein